MHSGNENVMFVYERGKSATFGKHLVAHKNFRPFVSKQETERTLETILMLYLAASPSWATRTENVTFSQNVHHIQL